MPASNDWPPERTNLAFVSADDLGKLNYWNVTPSGNDSEDDERGFQYGREAVAFMEQAEDSPALLIHIAHQIAKTGRFGPLEAGFFSAIATAALLHHNALRLGWIERDFFGGPIVLPGFTAPANEPPKTADPRAPKK